MEIFYYLTYWDKIQNQVKSFLPGRNYGMDFRFSGNNGNIECAFWDDDL